MTLIFNPKTFKTKFYTYKDGTLEDQIAYKRAVNKELEYEHIQLWIIQLLKGIDFLHTNKLVHRDLKPS